MRMEQVWDKWMLLDEDGFHCGIDPEAPEEVKEAYEKHIKEKEEASKKGAIHK